MTDQPTQKRVTKAAVQQWIRQHENDPQFRQKHLTHQSGLDLWNEVRGLAGLGYRTELDFLRQRVRETAEDWENADWGSTQRAAAWDRLAAAQQELRRAEGQPDAPEEPTEEPADE